MKPIKASVTSPLPLPLVYSFQRWIKVPSSFLSGLGRDRQDLFFPLDLLARQSPHRRTSVLCSWMLWYIVWICLETESRMKQATIPEKTEKGEIHSSVSSFPFIFRSFFQLLFLSFTLLLVLMFFYRLFMEMMADTKIEHPPKASCSHGAEPEEEVNEEVTNEESLLTIDEECPDLIASRSPLMAGGETSEVEDPEGASVVLREIKNKKKKNGNKECHAKSNQNHQGPCKKDKASTIIKKASGVPSAFRFPQKSEEELNALADSAVEFLFAVLRSLFLFRTDYPLRRSQNNVSLYRAKHVVEGPTEVEKETHVLPCMWKRAVLIFGTAWLGYASTMMPPFLFCCLCAAGMTWLPFGVHRSK